MKKTPAIYFAWPTLTRSPWLFSAMVLWVFFVFLFFFIRLYAGWENLALVFPPSGKVPVLTSIAQRFAIWKESFLALATGFLVTGIFWSGGKRLFNWFSFQSPQPLRFCLEIGLGIFFLNNLWLGLGLTRLWIGFLWLGGFILLTLLFSKDFLEVVHKEIVAGRPKGLNLWLVLLCAFYLFLLFLHSVLPETFYDSLNYFLGMPSFWLWHHGICDYPTHLLSGYFHGGSLFFINGFVLTGTEGAKVLAALPLIGTALVCYSWAGEIAGLKPKTVAFLAVFTFPLLYLNSWDVRVDGLLTFILLLFFYCLEKGVSPKNSEIHWITVAGLFAGLALSIKPTAIVGLAAAFLALLWRDGFSILRKKGWLVFGGGLVLGVGPWLLKNFCFAGNPLFPYAISWMGGRQFPADSYQRLLHENQRFLPMDHGLLSILTLPWRLTIPGAGDDQFIGPLLLAFLPLFVLLRFKDPTLKYLGRTLFLSLLAGLSMSHMLRFSIPAFVLGFLVLSVALSQMNAKWNWTWIGAVITLALLCIPEYLSISTNRYEGWGIWSGKEDRRGYIDRKTELEASSINSRLPRNARLLEVGDSQVLYYRRPAYANSVFDEQFFAEAARKETDAAGILKRLKELGVTHVLFNRALGPLNANEYHQYDLDAGQWVKLDDLVRRGLEPVVTGEAVDLYRVKAELGLSEAKFENPFSFFPPQAKDFWDDYSQQNYSKAESNLKQLQTFFPKDPYWMSMVAKLKGKVD